MTLKTMLQKIAKAGWRVDPQGRIRTLRAMAGNRCLCPLEAASVLILGYERPVWAGVRQSLGVRSEWIIVAADHKLPGAAEAVEVRALMLKILKPEGGK